ncbi:hypothetical protein IE81DRAFT_322283 [Ceraceosorus guamensis]|uniref:C2H2-type domain-containing protein n=1 Tax=Ceraceosorus guamensis TaxID=1522189 RepID=A0A316W3E9_9BASI|nr:hypothetical protein IE81DRAFT_322283 [Ceraceosorus guamensis]PWN43628.1 hypothetical protein IE81DRAFT_322283 [Ceraceosorus guamensis]
MPRLTKVQREVRDARREAQEAARDATADVIGASSRSKPTINSLSNNTKTQTKTKTTGGGQASPTRDAVDAPSSDAVSGAPGAAAPPMEIYSDVSTSEDEEHDRRCRDHGVVAGVHGGSTIEAKASAQGMNASRQRHSSTSDGEEDEDGRGGAQDEGEAKCNWQGCGETFHSLVPFVEHIHNTHIGINKNKYACEWIGCGRRGKAQTSRFALISHIRSHTGEKPFVCPSLECDKSFTRSDALHKHMRVHHDMVPQTGRAAKLAETRAANASVSGLVKQEEDPDESAGGAGAGVEETGQEAAPAADEWSDSDGIPETYESRWLAPSSSSTGLTDEDLGIKRRKVDPTTQPGDADFLVFEEEIWEADMDPTLTTARREWIKRARERWEGERAQGSSSRRKKSVPSLGPAAGDTLDLNEDGKRAGRRSSSKSAPPTADNGDTSASGSTIEASAYSRRRYLVEKAKLRIARQHNAQLNKVATELGEEFRQTREDRDNALKAALIREMGHDVLALWTPPNSP